jgi:hypothetical protein
MKKLLTIVLFMAATTAIFAGSNDKIISPEKKLNMEIQDQVAVPPFLTERIGEHIAQLIFTVNANGTINIQNIETPETDLKDNLMRQVKDFKVNTAGLDLNTTYKVALRLNVVEN